MTALLLDTHAWIWIVCDDPRLSNERSRIRRASASGELLLATVSLYEAARIGMESDIGRRSGRQAIFMRPTVNAWIRDALAASGVAPVELLAEMSIDAATSSAMHSDPFDRLIVATAQHAKARLVTADEKILSCAKQAGVPTLAL